MLQIFRTKKLSWDLKAHCALGVAKTPHDESAAALQHSSSDSAVFQTRHKQVLVAHFSRVSKQSKGLWRVLLLSSSPNPQPAHKSSHRVPMTRWLKKKKMEQVSKRPLHWPGLGGGVGLGRQANSTVPSEISLRKWWHDMWCIIIDMTSATGSFFFFLLCLDGGW